MSKSRDKQLARLRITHLLEKRKFDQALNIKEFATLAGVSYTTARLWFREPGFPTIGGVVFWADFVEWRRAYSGLAAFLHERNPPRLKPSHNPTTPETPGGITFTGKAAAILRSMR